ncbi:hypothetical protein D3C75_1263990 [compost metagenome]
MSARSETGAKNCLIYVVKAYSTPICKVPPAIRPTLYQTRIAIARLWNMSDAGFKMLLRRT